jgi:hypothetical protein
MKYVMGAGKVVYLGGKKGRKEERKGRREEGRKAGMET